MKNPVFDPIVTVADLILFFEPQPSTRTNSYQQPPPQAATGRYKRQAKMNDDRYSGACL